MDSITRLRLAWGVVFAALLVGIPLALSYRQAPLSLGALDVFFILTTVVSLGFNLFQYVKDKDRLEPLKNGLIALFNALKSKQQRFYQQQQETISMSRVTPLPPNLLLYKVFDTTSEVLMDLDELREHVVGAILTLDPTASDKNIFRAAEFGLNEQEKQFRREGMERFVARHRQANTSSSPAGGAGGPAEGSASAAATGGMPLGQGGPPAADGAVAADGATGGAPTAGAGG